MYQRRRWLALTKAGCDVRATRERGSFGKAEMKKPHEPFVHAVFKIWW
jgi:hypothetical protein